MSSVNNKVIGSFVTLYKRPYKLNYHLNRIVYDTSDFFFKNNNDSVYWHYVKPLTEFFNNKDLKKICHFNTTLQTLNGMNLNGIGRRVQLTTLFREFAQQCWVNTRSYTLESFHRMMLCPPVGFQHRYFGCFHPLCLNCHLRKAVQYTKELQESDAVNTGGIAIKIDVPFKDNLYGYSPVVIKGESRFKKVKRILNPKGKNAIACSSGIAMHKKYPYISTCLHALFPCEDLEMKYCKALALAEKIEKQEKEYGTKVTVIKVTNKAELTYHMYNNCPILLLATSNGFSDHSLQNTVNDFFEYSRNKKLNRIKSV